MFPLGIREHHRYSTLLDILVLGRRAPRLARFSRNHESRIRRGNKGGIRTILTATLGGSCLATAADSAGVSCRSQSERRIVTRQETTEETIH